MKTLKELRIFDSAYDYAKDADISQFEDSRQEDRLCFPFSFVLSDDPDFQFIADETIEIKGKAYREVNWGEAEKSYLLDGAENEKLWGIYMKKRAEKGDGYQALPQIFETKEVAEQEILLTEKQYKEKYKGNEIKQLRTMMQRKNISQERAARDLNVSTRTVFRWIHKQNQPNALARKAIRDYLESSVKS